MTAVQNFLQEDVGRTLRVNAGVPQVFIVNGGYVSLVNQLARQGYDDLNTKYLVFADMQGDLGCGVTTTATSQLPSFSILWMEACRGNYPGQAPQSFPNESTYLVLHELLHGLGAVPGCAPNHDGTGHVNDSNRDMLWQGPGGRDWNNLTIDVGRNDYYGHSIPNCPDIADSPYWADAAPPPPPGSGFPVEADECAPGRITIDMNTNGGDGRGTPGRDVILGTPNRDFIYGYGGNDVICGGDGIDYIYAGTGQDIVFGGGGSDRIYGQESIDILLGGSGADRIYGGDGDDRLYGQGGKDFMWGEAGNDEMQGNHQSDQLFGGPGNDELRGAGGKDKLFGDEGNDKLFGGNNTDYLDGGPGTDEANGQRGKDNPLNPNTSGCIAETQTSC